ncbi:MAG TPA: hypothetical protein VES42_21675 [Pilimelia sp.]|nr:hypothetical protein [Pilimelia sp.]
MIGKMAKRYAVLAVAVPLAAAGARKLSQSMEARRGPTRSSRLLRTSADMLQRTTGRPTKPRRW